MPQRELTLIPTLDFPRLTSFRYAPFVYDAWRSPEVLAIVSKIAGVELVPQMDFEIAHMNVSVQTEEEKQAALAALTEKASRDADEGVSGCPWEDDRPIVDWHTDSYPFVCVLMLSDCTNMIGGETALRCGNGEVMKVRGPGMVRPFLPSLFEGKLIRYIGLCRCPSRSLHRTSGSSCSWYQRANHHGHIFPPQVCLHQGRHSLDYRPSSL